MITTLRQWFDNFTEETGEQVTHIVLKDSDWDAPPSEMFEFNNVPVEIMNQPFSSGFGGNQSPNLCAWSENYVLFNDNYDGAESLCWVPRHPKLHDPIRPGGG